MTPPCPTSLLLPILFLSWHPLLFQGTRRVLRFLSVLGVSNPYCTYFTAGWTKLVSIALPACQPLASQMLTVSTWCHHIEGGKRDAWQIQVTPVIWETAWESLGHLGPQYWHRAARVFLLSQHSHLWGSGGGGGSKPSLLYLRDFTRMSCSTNTGNDFILSFQRGHWESFTLGLY